MKTELLTLSYCLGEAKPANHQDLARFFGTSNQTVSCWSSGKFKPNDAARALLELALRVGEARPDLLRSVAAADPGSNGAERLIAALGVREAVKLAGTMRADRTVARLALLVETVQREALELLHAPVVVAPVEPVPFPWATVEPVYVAPTRPVWPTAWTSPDGITVAIPEHVQGPLERVYLPYVKDRAEWLRSKGLTTDVEN